MVRGKNAWTGLLALAGVIVFAGQALAFRSGPPSARNGSTASGGATCSQCHGSSVGSGSVEILGAPTGYAPGVTYNLTVRIADPVQAGAGFQLSVEDGSGTHVGTLVLADPTNTQFNGEDPNWVNHTSTGVGNAVTNWAGMGNAAEYNVDWIAPGSDVGAITFWAVGNAINNNFSQSGDLIYLTDTSATFADPVPAVSTWGLVALTLVMLVAATSMLSRRPRTAQAAV